MKNAHFTSNKLCLVCQSHGSSFSVNKHAINPKDELSKAQWMILNKLCSQYLFSKFLSKAQHPSNTHTFLPIFGHLAK